MTRGALLALVALSCAAGCHRSAPDAVPPAPSGGLAAAPPGALGAHAAGLGAGGTAWSPLGEPPEDTPPPAAGGSSGSAGSAGSAGARPPAPAPPPPASGVAL